MEKSMIAHTQTGSEDQKETIGASIFVRNAIEYDYCIIEAVQSLLKFDQVVIVDCCSTDGTTQMLFDRFGLLPNVKLVTGQPWEVAYGEAGKRLAIIANIARLHLQTKWHFMLQADEVLPEDSYTTIKSIIKACEFIGESLRPKKFMCYRFNLWGNKDLIVRFDSKKRPVGDVICRLALTTEEVIGDAESINPEGALQLYASSIPIIHYGFIRKGFIQLKKIKDMQTWFWGSPEAVDKRAIAQLEDDGIFRPCVWIGREDLQKLPIRHPKHMAKWLSERCENDPSFEVIEEATPYMEVTQ